jgi:deoxyhypusine synthase
MTDNTKESCESIDLEKVREEILEQKIDPVSPTNITNMEDLLVSLKNCAFQGRNLGEGLDVFEEMVMKEDCVKVLTLSGAMVPAGMEQIVIEMIEYGFIDVVITTGANIIHSLVNGFSPEQQSHYVGTSNTDDNLLNDLKINRIYDVYLPEEEYERAEKLLYPIITDHMKSLGALEGNSSKTPFFTRPSDLFEAVGKKIPGRSFLKTAALHNVPVFCGATSDSEFSLNLTKYRKRNNLWVILDEIGDIQKFADIIKVHQVHGTIIVGGGVPRNWAQQIFPYLDQIKHSDTDLEDPDEYDFHGYTYSVRMHTATEYDGGLSGCTIKESISWGKYKPQSKYASVWGDATINFPILVAGLIQRLKRKGLLKKRK